MNIRRADSVESPVIPPRTLGSLFSGIGGLDLGVEYATGGRCVWQVEKEEFGRVVLAKHWPDVARYDDVCTVGGVPMRHVLPRVDAIIGGSPCQDLSLAGKRAGFDGAKSSLWREYLRIVSQLRPRFMLLENVPGLHSSNGGWDFAEVLGGLAALGYDATWDLFRASDVGAPQRRERVFLLAYMADTECGRRSIGRDARDMAEACRCVRCAGRQQAVGTEGGGSDGLADAASINGERTLAVRDRRGRSEASVGDCGGGRTGDVAHGDPLRELQPQGSECHVGRWSGDGGESGRELADSFGGGYDRRASGSDRNIGHGEKARWSEDPNRIADGGEIRDDVDARSVDVQRLGRSGVVPNSAGGSQGEAHEWQRRSTPTAHDAKHATLNRNTDDLAVQSGAGKAAPLNADWVGCLMGFPPGWTDVPAIKNLRPKKQNP